MKIDSAPGPDNISSKLLINADKTVLDFLLQIFIKSWKEGYLPKQWKKANVKYSGYTNIYTFVVHTV
jgi:hypothetical protein